MIKQFYWVTREKLRDAYRRYAGFFRRAFQDTKRTVCDISEQMRILLLVIRLGAVGHSRKPSTAAARRSVLIVSYFSPPYRSAYGTQRINKFMKFLLRWGWDVTLLTTEPSAPEEQDVKGEGVPKGVHVLRMAAPRQLASLRWSGRIVPDELVHWVRPALVKAQQLVRDRGISVVLATAPPYSNLLVGAICASRCGLPFVPDYRDPWSMINIPPWYITRPGLRQLNRWMESTVLKSSAKVVITDDIDYVHEYLPVYHESLLSKIVSITNGFDEEDFKGLSPSGERRAKFTISYVGSVYDEETLNNLIMPFRVWQQSHPADLQDVEFVYAGSHSKFFAQCGALPFYFRDSGYVTHQEAILLRMNSDLQLFSQPRHFKAHVYSGKIFEMLRTGVPILAITRPDGAVAKLIKETNAGFSIAQDNPEAAAAVLKTLFDKWRNGQCPAAPDEAAVNAWSREALAHRLSDTLDEII